MKVETRPAPVLIVGIGASAGGVEALKDLFSVLPTDAGLAYVVIQHLEPHHDSHMAEILGSCTTMTVVQAENGMPVLPNRVYTNPAGGYLSIAEGRLVLGAGPDQDRIRLPIDVFLTSLAEDQHEAAACVILSGSGADGTRGVRAVCGAGGLCVAQHPDDARFPSMPQSAIGTGLVDEVLSLAQMPAALVAFAGYVRGRVRGPVAEATAAADASSDELEAILKILRVRANSDYRHYKKATIVRRIHRRMALKQISDLARYRELLAEDQRELTQLSRDMLIGVSSFFRDPDAFDELRRLAIDPLVAGGDPDSAIRAWVPGCATGEEAYSVAMLLLEAAAAAGSPRRVQVFASDLDDHALEIGRAGVYPGSIAAAVSAERLERFFAQQGDAYKVSNELREVVVFSRQDIITDPPFSRLDLVSCRNLLIYIEPATQKKLLAMFGFALKPGGYLFLGKSEGISGMHELFAAVSEPERIFRLIGSSRHAVAAFPRRADGRPVGVLARGRIGGSALALMQANQAVLLKHFRAAIVLVDPQGQILHFFGETERYLGHAKGLASLNVLDIAPGALAVKLRKALAQAAEQDEVVEIAGAPISSKGAARANLAVMRVPAAAACGHDAGHHLRGCGCSPYRCVARAALPGGRCPGVPARRRVEDPPRRAAGRRRGFRDRHRGAQGGQRRSPVHERGAAVRQRGARGLQGGAAVAERGADHRQQPARREARRAHRHQQRPGQPALRHRDRHRLPGRPAAHQALHAPRHGAAEPDSRGRRPVDQPHHRELRRHGSRRGLPAHAARLSRPWRRRSRTATGAGTPCGSCPTAPSTTASKA